MIEAYRALVTQHIGAAALEAAKAHARAEFPKESCGFIARPRLSDEPVYIACENAHPTPTTHFEIIDPRFERTLQAERVVAIVHSHPNGPAAPSHADMVQQVVSDVPWVIITLNEDAFGETIAWGGDLPIAPVIARPFVHGVLDCYALLRDVFRLGHDELLKQGVHWPLPPILLPEVPRADDWWETDDDLYMTHFAKFGFRVINRVEARAGDVFLMKVGKNPLSKINHAGVLLEHDQVLQHFSTSPSGRRATGLWAANANIWLRYEGQPS